MAQREPNAALERLYRETGWTLRQFAQQVNRIGTECGTPTNYSPQTARAWLKGHVPGGDARLLIVEALSRKLQRPITRADAGLPSSTDQGEQLADLVTRLLELGEADMHPTRRSMLNAGLYSAALAVPAFRDFVSDGASGRKETQNAHRIGVGDVATVRTTTSRIADLLDEMGGGIARPMAAAFLVNTVGPYLRASATEKVRQGMLSAASDLVYLTGWMAMYEREHGLGQRYYLKALGLAGEANDKVTYCRTLRGMSLQASNLRYGRKSLELADSAAEAAPAAGPRLLAFLRGQQAHAASLVGDRHQAWTRLREAESALSKADSRRESLGGYDASAYKFHVSHVLYEFGDLPGSIKAMQDCLKLQPTQERQGRIHSHALLAQRQLELGHLEESCKTWHAFLDDYSSVTTARGDEHLATLRTRIAPYLRNREAGALDERAREIGLAKRVR
ncbi:hypothetical protein [Streptomyces sp. NPDC018031]|uniref:hypothetical protein n=1 Tax=Streptomyces sp. NPDC018031 TaxID=3365033 RepID=UPI003797ADD3